MRLIRIALSLAVLVGVVFAVSAAAEDGAKCDCWYWSSNQYGVITTTTLPNGQTTQDCVVQACTKSDLD